MRLIVNIFLIAFFIDSGLSVLSTLLVTIAGITTLSVYQSFFGLFVLIFSLVVYILTGINSSIPKKQTLPLIFFLFWAVISAPPMPLFFAKNTQNIILSFIQLFFSLTTFWYIRRKTGSWLFTFSQIPGFSFSLRNTFLFFGINLIFIPFLMLTIAFTSLQSLLDQKTAGFLRLSHDGIYMEERIYMKAEKTIRLIGMIHIGEDSFYKNLMRPAQQTSSILLAEGVSDRKGLVKSGFSTKGFAKTYGLQSQEDITIEGDLITDEELHSDGFSAVDTTMKIMQADVDISSFRPDTIEFLNIAGKYIFKEESFGQGIAEYNQWIKTNGSPELIADIKNDIIDKRNEKIISLLKPAVEKFSMVIVPWGAMHMPAIEKAVQQMGFNSVKTIERRSMVFSTERIKTIAASFSTPANTRETSE